MMYPDSTKRACIILLFVKKIKKFISLAQSHLAIFINKKIPDFRMKRASLCKGWRDNVFFRLKIWSKQKKTKMLRTEEMTEQVCENCRFSRPLTGHEEPALICEHKALSEGNWCVVTDDGSCPNFDFSSEIVAAEVAAALAEGAKLIPLTQDKFAIVDAEDYPRLCKYKWCLSKNGRNNYALTSVRVKQARRKTLLIHRFILNAPPGLVVDHRNRNGLDNRKSNLRPCTHVQNTQNRRPNRNTYSKYKGVCWSKYHNKFRVRIIADGKRYHLGYFTDEIAAAKAYDKKAKELFGEFAYLNFPAEVRDA